MASAKISKAAPTTQEVCIDLPGEQVKCWRSSDNIRVILRKHRDVVVDISLQPGAIYTLESKSEFYNPVLKKLVKKIEFLDGDRFNIWIGREFGGTLVLKAAQRILGTYDVSQLDDVTYDGDPKAKPEPLMIVMGKRAATAAFYSLADPLGLRTSQDMFKKSLELKLPLLNGLGTKFDYTCPSDSPDVQEYAAVTEVAAQDIQPQIIAKLERGGSVSGNASEIFLPPRKNEQPSALYRAMVATLGFISGNAFFTSNITKESFGYLVEHFKSLDQLGMKAHLEKKAKGMYRAVLKGHTLTNMLAHKFRGTALGKPPTRSFPLGSSSSAFIDGGFKRTGKAGYGGVRRMFITSAKNFKSGMKIQVIGTVIDIIVDADTVFFDEQGSKDLSEFLGRAGVSIVKAGVTAALGSISAAVVGGALLAAGAPLVFTVAVVVGGFIAAAMLVDLIDDTFEIKESMASLAR